MKKSMFTEEQILFALKQAEAGQPVWDVCRQMGASEATFYVWKKRYGNLGLLEVRELRQLRDENTRPERAVPDDAKVGHGKTTIRVRASAYLADPRGLASWAEQGSPAVQTGGPPSTYENPSQEAHQSASRAGATGNGSGAILGNGFRARRADERQEVLSIDRYRQAASSVCGATDGLCTNRAKCRRCTERGSLRARSTVCDNCRS